MGNRARQPTALRLACARALSATFDGASLEQSRQFHFQGLDAERQPLGRELLDGTVRWFYRLDWQLSELLDRPLPAKQQPVFALLLLGLYQLQYMRTPAARVVNESVAACRSLGRPGQAGMVNAVLRRASRELQPEVADGEPDEARLASPQWLIDRLRKDWPDQWEAMLDASNRRAPMALRVNRQQTDLAAYQQELQSAELEAAPVPGSPWGLLLSQPVPTTRLPGFATGKVSVQDASAQLAAELLGAAAGERILDACAAPGGKSAHLLEREPGITLHCLDESADRLTTLRSNLERLAFDPVILEGDAGEPAAWWDGQPYDRILLDAPCSATGVIRRHPDIRLLRRETDIAKLAAKQRGLLAALWELLKPGGRLLYATCSLLREENESIVSAFIASEPGVTVVPMEIPAAHPCQPGYQLLPADGAGDGFYFCLLEKS